MKSLMICIGISVAFFGKAQQILPLNTPFSSIPNGAFVKDINNELNPYIGTYKANFNGNEITLFITKQENKLEETGQKNYHADVLVIKYIIKNSSGIILQDTQQQYI